MNNILIQCGEHLDNKKRILSLALHLKNNGHNPIVLLYSNDSQLFKIHKINTIKYYDYRNRDIKITPPFEIDFDDVFYTEKHRSPSKFIPSEINKRYSELERESNALYDLLISLSVDNLFIWNGFTGVVANTLRFLSNKMNIPTFYMERGLKRDSLFVDPEGVNAASSFSKSSLKNYVHKENSQQENSISKLDIDEFRSYHKLGSKKIIFLPLQVQTDTNNILYSSEVKNMRKFILLVNKALGDKYSKSHVLVVREHPEEIDKKLNLPRIKNVKYINEGNIDDWCDVSDLVININSTVGMQALLRGTPTISLGMSIYTGKGITIESTIKTLENDIHGILSGKLTLCMARVRKFYSALNELTQSSVDNIPKPLRMGLCPIHTKYNYRHHDPKIVERLKNKVNIGCPINVGINISRADYLDLTYRKNKVELTPEIFKSLLGEFWNYEVFFLQEADFSFFIGETENMDIVLSNTCFVHDDVLYFNNYLVPNYAESN